VLKKPLPDRVICRIAARAELPVLFVFYIACLLLVSSPRGPTGDAFDYSILTKSLVDDHSWEAAPSVGADPKNMVRAPDGRTYSFFPAGQSLILVPFYFFGKVVSAWARAENQPMIELLSWHLTSAALTALTGALLCSFLMTRFGAAKALAFLVSALYVFATMALPYSKLHYSEPLLALLVLLAAHALVSPLSPRSLPLLSAAIGAMVLTKPAFVLLAPVFIALFLWYRNGRGITFRDVAWAALAAAPFALVFGYWNFIRTGSMWDIGRSAR